MIDPIKVLIVDDNARYRAAFAQNLLLQGMQVIQAEDGDQALALLKVQSADVMVTDLQMRRATEGLDLIRDARTILPYLPVIMISAVGTFDEGAQASQLGAAHVLSKARIEDEMDILYDCIRRSCEQGRAARATLEEIAALRQTDAETPADPEPALKRLREILESPGQEPYVKSEAFEAVNQLGEAQLRQRSRLEADQARLRLAEAQHDRIEKLNQDLLAAIPAFDQMDADTREALRAAEYIFLHGGESVPTLEMSRSTCFSYCFAVENQAKVSTRKRIIKFLGEATSYQLIARMVERDSDHVNMFLQQHLLQIMRDRQMDFTIENIRQTFQRILAHRVKYRPDGLKALGIMILLFGRTYEVRGGRPLKVDNPLALKGLDQDEEVIRFAEQLINLQHYRNPYVHPEIDGQQAIPRIRETAVACLNLMMRLR